MRSDHEHLAATPVADIRDALACMDDQSVKQLRGENFITKVPHIFDSMFIGDAGISKPHAVLSGSEDCPEVRVALYNGHTKGTSEAAELALAQLAMILLKVARPVKLQPGDLAVINNYVSLHGRSSFAARYDGNDRWLQRLHVVDSLWPFRHLQKSSIRLLD